jgi:c-di-GMP-binding flagellar brake protein YcgR
MTKERRRNLRISCSIPVLLRFPARDQREGWGTLYDISLGGIKMETRMPLVSGESIFLSFVVGDNYVFENTRGKIVRVVAQEGYYIAGVEFSLVVDRDHLKEGLHSLLEMESAS